MRLTTLYFLLVALAGNSATGESSSVRRAEIGHGVYAEVTPGRQRMGLSLTPPKGAVRQPFLESYLAKPSH